MTEHLDSAAISPEAVRLAAQLGAGKTLKELRQLSDADLEAYYAFGEELYGQGKYDEAETVFRVLSVCDHTQSRFWMGLGACRQMRGDFAWAILAYHMAATLDETDPRVFLHAGECCLGLKDAENARLAFAKAVELGQGGEKHAAVVAKAQALRDILQQDATGPNGQNDQGAPHE